jgi:co-chaperonin GroES (HSP10)
MSGRVLLAPLPKRTRTASGLVSLTESYQDDSMQYQVLGIGPPEISKKGVPIDPEVRPGQYVMAELHAQHHTLPDGTKIIRASQLLAVWDLQ